MHPGVLRDGLTLLTGLGTGMLSGAFGVGGASLSTPGIRLLGASAYLAVGTTLPSIFPGAVVGTIRYRREGLVVMRAVAWTVPIGVLAAVAGSLASHAIPGKGHWLMIATALLLGLSAGRLGRERDPGPDPQPNPAPNPGPDAPPDAGPSPGLAAATAGDRGRTGRLLAVGLAAGAMSGLLGVGGGIVIVPGLVEVAGYSLKQAVATSLLCVGLLAIPSTVAHALLGDIDWRFALLLIAGVLPGAEVGARLAVRAGDHRFRLAVRVFLSTLAVVYGAGELIALIRA